jgi:DNA-binding transcriptional LysR family regulator
LNRPPSPAALIAFVRSAEFGSFAAAARHLDVSAAAVGQTVRRLEEAFGVKLFSRTTRKTTLTPEGRRLFERSRALIGELDEIARVFEESRGVVAGPLRISAPLGFGRRHVMPLVARFITTHPAVEVTLDTSDTVRDFADDQVDVAFRILRPVDSAVVARRIARLHAVTLASPEYLRRHGAPRHPRELAGHACVVYRHPATGVLAPLSFRVRGRDLTVTPRASVVVNDVDTACVAAVLGLGLVQPPSDYAAPYVREGKLRSVLDRFRTAPFTLYLCYAGARRLPLRVRTFVEFARNELAKERFTLEAQC